METIKGMIITCQKFLNDRNLNFKIKTSHSFPEIIKCDKTRFQIAFFFIFDKICKSARLSTMISLTLAHQDKDGVDKIKGSFLYYHDRPENSFRFT